MELGNSMKKFGEGGYLCFVAVYEPSEYFLSVRCLLLANSANQAICFVWFEIAMMFIGMDAQSKAFTVTLWVKLGGINIAANTKHLYRAGIAGH